jgi:hypothetical protein
LFLVTSFMVLSMWFSRLFRSATLSWIKRHFQLLGEFVDAVGKHENVFVLGLFEILGFLLETN